MAPIVVPRRSGIKPAGAVAFPPGLLQARLHAAPSPITDQPPIPDPMKKAVIETSRGTMTAELFDTEVPNTVANFEKLANAEFYDGTRFHRVIPDFMVQGGDPLSRNATDPRVGTGGPGYKIKCETHLNTHRHVAGTLSMAHAGKDTGGSQFFICHSPQPHLDKKHTVFGQVTDGLDVVNAIRKDDVITKIRVL